MPSEKSPGLKILWVWTLGTAASTLSFSYIIYSRSYTHTHTYLSFIFFFAVLVTSVVRTRLRDMETVMNGQQQQQEPISSDVLLADTVPGPEDVVREEIS